MIADALMLSALLAGWVILLHRDGTYQDYLSSFGWRFTKALRKRGKCQQCGTRTRLQLHHLSYDWHNRNPLIRDYVPNLFDPMETLCDYHHGKAHGKKGN